MAGAGIRLLIVLNSPRCNFGYSTLVFLRVLRGYLQVSDVFLRLANSLLHVALLQGTGGRGISPETTGTFECWSSTTTKTAVALWRLT